MTIAVLLTALLLDALFSEPGRYHPLAGFGKIATWLETRLNRQTDSNTMQLLKGLLALLFLLLPLALVGFFLQQILLALPWLYWLTASLIVYFCIGWQSLLQHAQAVVIPLQQGDMAASRSQLAMIVSRDTSDLDENAVAVAATESVLENGADAVFSALFWFLLGGLAGVLVYRASNTLDAMWGYKNSRFLYFGKTAARLDDLLNFIPARITALLYALCGCTKTAFTCWYRQGKNWESPNAGVVMASGAGALATRLGGNSFYHGNVRERPVLGMAQAEQANVKTIAAACSLLNRALLLFVLLVVIAWWLI